MDLLKNANTHEPHHVVYVKVTQRNRILSTDTPEDGMFPSQYFHCLKTHHYQNSYIAHGFLMFLDPNHKTIDFWSGDELKELFNMNVVSYSLTAKVRETEPCECGKTHFLTIPANIQLWINVLLILIVNVPTFIPVVYIPSLPHYFSLGK